MRDVKRLVILATLLAGTAFGHAPPNGSTFEVASVKPADAQARGLCTGGPGTSDPGTFSCPHVSLAALIYRAYDLEFQFYRFKPTDWMETTWFTVVAKVPAGTTRG